MTKEELEEIRNLFKKELSGLEESFRIAELRRREETSTMRIQLMNLELANGSVSARLYNLEQSSKEATRSINTRLENLEQANKNIRQAPYPPASWVSTQHEIRAHSVSGPHYLN